MSSLQKIPAKRQKASGRGASASHLWQKQINLGDDKRTTLRLGLLSEKTANEISGHIDHLIESKRWKTTVQESTKAWLQTADKKLIKRLVSLKLCAEMDNPTVAELVNAYIARKTVDWASGTVSNFNQVKDLLIEYFPDALVSELTTKDSKAFWAWMRKDKSLGENTCRKHFQRCRQVFDDCIEQEVITRNPFRVSEIKVTVGVAAKDYVEESTIKAVIDHLPADDTEWRLLFAFSRYAGCRMPSEIEELTWNDIDWAQNTITIKSPKTKRYAGRAQRKIPIFPELQSLILSHSEAVPDGTIYVFPNLRSHSNLSTIAKRYVEAAGFTVWSEFWNSLRASRETDLMDSHGLRRACAWIGNTPNVAIKHYALLKHSDYVDAGVENGTLKSGAKSDAVPRRNGENEREQNQKNQGNQAPVKVKHPRQDSNSVGRPKKNKGQIEVTQKSDAKSDAASAQNEAERELLNAWRSADESARLEALSVLRCKLSRLES